jgi:hypothetical protein
VLLIIVLTGLGGVSQENQQPAFDFKREVLITNASRFFVG